MGVGIRLKTILRSQNLTIKQLSERANIPLNTLYSITKRDSERVDPVILQRIADALGVPTSQLMDVSLKVKEHQKEWKSNKAGRLYMSIDSNLLDLLETVSKKDGLSIEDEIEKILHENVEERFDGNMTLDVTVL